VYVRKLTNTGKEGKTRKRLYFLLGGKEK